MKYTLYILSFLLFACNSVHKITNTAKTATDSTHLVTNETAEIKKSDSSGTKTQDGQYEKETLYAYDTVYLPGKDGEQVIKYVPRIIRVVEKGTYVNNETAAKSNYDSAGVKQKDSTGLVKKVEVKQTDIKKSKFPVILALVGGVIILGVIGFAYMKSSTPKITV